MPIAVELVAPLGLPQAAVAVFGMVRNVVDRRVHVDALREAFVYLPRDEVDAGIAALRAAGILDGDDDGLGLAPHALEVRARLYGRLDDVVADLWAGHDATTAVLDPLTQRAVDAAGATGGPAFGVVAPVHEPAGASLAMRVSERLTPLRFHRFDAHVSAWRAAGLTVEEVVALGPGAARDAIEAETNRLAAAPYEALTPDERFTLVAALGSLPS